MNQQDVNNLMGVMGINGLTNEHYESLVNIVKYFEKVKEWKYKSEEGRDFIRYGIGGYSRLTELLKEVNI